MKKIILSILFAGSLSASFAQLDCAKSCDNWLVYGNAGFDNASNNGGNNTQSVISFNPGIGYNLSNRFTVGLQGGYTGTFLQNKGAKLTTNLSSEMNNVGLFFRHTCCAGKTFFFFSQINAGYATATNDSLVGTGFMINYTPSLGINVAHGFALTLNIGGISYSSLNYSNNLGVSNHINVNIGQSIQVGIQKSFCCPMHRTCAPKHLSGGNEVFHRDLEKLDNEDEIAPKSSKKFKNRDEEE